MRELLLGAFQAGIAAADPLAVVPPHLPAPPRGRLVVVGAGKATAAMAQAVEQHYRGLPLSGLVVTRYGHGAATAQIRVVEAAHPVPDEAGLQAAEEILDLAQSLNEDDLLLCLISGGGSALLAAPDGISMAEMAALTKALLRSGADIREINTVRKHLSRIQGGRLAAAAAPARVLSLILSDVAGDDLSSIASGPTVPDPTTFASALAVMDRYGLEFPAVRAHLAAGVCGERPETPKPGDPRFERVDNVIVANAQTMLAAAAGYLAAQGFTPLILSDSLTGEAREAAKFHAALVRQVIRYGQPVAPPCAIISGGETTVTVRGQGRGGRNSEFLLALALELNSLPGVWALAGDSDGIDGSEDNAGAVIDPDSLAALGQAEARRCLEQNDSYSAFARIGSLVMTGPTRTNVNDLRIVLVAAAT